MAVTAGAAGKLNTIKGISKIIVTTTTEETNFLLYLLVMLIKQQLKEKV